MRPRLFLCAALISCGAQAQLIAPPPSRPDELMRAVTAEVVAVFKADFGAGRPTDVDALVEKTIAPLFDFRRMTSMAVGRNWPLASEEQQDALVAEFRRLLVRTYSSSISGYRDQDIDYRPLRLVPGETEVLVRSLIQRRGAQALAVDYEMANGIAGWRVHDVKLEGVSLVITYRESFAATVRESGIDGLIKALSEKNRKNAGAG